MKTVTILNEKGGVGKTTIAVHLAAGLAIRGCRVLLVDTDGQANATIAFGLSKEPCFYNFAVRGAEFKDIVRRIPPERYYIPDEAQNVKGALLAIPSNVESRTIAQSISDAFIIMRRLQQVTHLFDYCIIDTSPTPSLLHTALYSATDGLIFPTKCEMWSFDGLAESIAHKQNFDPFRERYGLPAIEVYGIVPTLYRPRTNEHSENLLELKKAFPDKVWEPMPQLTIWAEAATLSRSIFSVAPDSQAAQDGWGLVDQFLEAVHATA